MTGHKGYVGQVLVPMLRADGHEVVGLDSDLFEGCSYSPPVLSIPSIRKDIRDVEATDLKGFDTIIHLAALSNDPLGDLDQELTYFVNHKASVRLARLAKEVGVARFLFSSSCSVYGKSREDLLTEQNDPHPLTHYATSKLLAEKGILELANSSFSPIILRSATAYGVSPSLRFDLVLNNLVAWALTTGKILLKTEGSQWRPLVHVEDMSRVFLSIINAPLDCVRNEIFNVGITEENYRVLELARIVNEEIPESQVARSRDFKRDERSYRVDFSKLARTIPGFEPRWSASRGAEQLHASYKRSGLVSPHEFEGAKYGRIRYLKRLRAAGHLDKDLRWSAPRESLQAQT